MESTRKLCEAQIPTSTIFIPLYNNNTKQFIFVIYAHFILLKSMPCGTKQLLLGDCLACHHVWFPLFFVLCSLSPLFLFSPLSSAFFGFFYLLYVIRLPWVFSVFHLLLLLFSSILYLSPTHRAILISVEFWGVYTKSELTKF
jgi:hypothetical protein